MRRINSEVVYNLVRAIAKKLDQEEDFEKDPEVYTVGMLVVARDELKPGRTIGQVLEEAPWENNQETAMRLLGRKKVTAK
ncbi:MAG: hypothetical protein A3C06_00675 [Candidatus Taylorbacteria bacterium RIFCSPHIGHO2_02_FULL_46_13]|uniref:Uncharacterized protein n=2 Tax=Parcubacteria group TaxID=1794811 RepID=A0A1G2HT33_9BACT|nr:MAG: hypothetical protein A2822_03625 [Candidatus Staskawiczbacteria bacterium RIFCSPHIGHO2_01_FULL_41_41]OGZ75035.1 MAG: hypothetical protein A3A12_04405 [Candidatus Staskawiczbacteria bacterium RIFCSPLOWO2_01_FULL_43_17b]OHA26054.1 MAG: hypothetical protein A3C06_00675 [Candidatus Taylorbacteria bacterium RIFCSPHIGHO2_02_FULL_46_13]